MNLSTYMEDTAMAFLIRMIIYRCNKSKLHCILNSKGPQLYLYLANGFSSPDS
jgi:hypothetical protein